MNFTLEQVLKIQEEERELALKPVREAIEEAKKTKGWDGLDFRLHQAIDNVFAAAYEKS